MSAITFRKIASRARPPARVGSLAACALAACALAAFAFASGARAAEQHYMATGLPFFDPYRVAIATLDVNGGKVSGTLAAPAGDPRPALPVSGTLADGVLTLTVGSGNEAYNLSFAENQRGLHRIFEETATVPGLDPVVLFRPQAGFAEPALVLQHDAQEWCGSLYGGLTVTLRAADLAAQPAAPAGLAELEAVVEPQHGGSTKVRMKDIWSRLRLAARAGDDLGVEVAVPVGTEAKAAQEIRRIPQVAAVTLPALCGETALVVVPRGKLTDAGKVSELKLKGYADAVLARWLSGAAPDAGSPGPRKFRIDSATAAAGPGGGLVFRATVTGEAEATRLGKGMWDQFTLTLTPLVTATDAADTISLIPSVSDVKAARKSGAQVPADSAFKALDDSEVTAGISLRLISWLAAAERSRCVFLTKMPFDEPDGSLSCANVAMDEVQVPDEN